MLSGQSAAAPKMPPGAISQPAVPSALHDLELEINRLDDAATQLLSRIAPILSASKGEEANAGSRIYAHCEVSEQIFNKAQYVRSIADRVFIALDRLEI